MSRVPRFALSLVMTLSLAIPVSAAPAGRPETFESGGSRRICRIYAPETLTPGAAAPLLLLFHGSGRDGGSQIREWKKLADEKGVILAAPDSLDPKLWVIPADGPELLRDLVHFVSERHAVDSRRIYAFGHSGGAVFALRMAPMESQFLAAVAIHAGAFRTPADAGILPFATRKTPMLLIVGTKDQNFSVSDVRQTAETLVSAGFPATVHEIAGHNHDYYRRSAEVNRLAWEFLSQQKLAAEARYTPYRIEMTPAGAVSIIPVQ